MAIRSNYWTCPRCLTRNYLEHRCVFCFSTGYTSTALSTSIHVPSFSEEVKTEEKQIINKKLLLLQ